MKGDQAELSGKSPRLEKSLRGEGNPVTDRMHLWTDGGCADACHSNSGGGGGGGVKSPSVNGYTVDLYKAIPVPRTTCLRN